MKRIIKLFLLSFAFLIISGCNTTRGIGYANPEYQNYSISNVAVYVDNAGDSGRLLEENVVNMLSEKGAKARGVRDLAKFSTSHEEFVEKVWALGVKEVLVLVASDSSGSSTVGYQSFGNATTFGNSTSMNMTTMPMTSISRAIRVDAKLYNNNGDIVWAGDAKREASGLAFIGDGTMTRNAAMAVIQALEDSNTI
ncbi:hypothetical protein ACSEE7_18235 [Halomonas cupida]|uniref:hypothetical protein n=1 Tax=Halomonas cupida TaxID=44933 RepID=UPI003EF5C6E6